jgi:hypothetical protein
MTKQNKNLIALGVLVVLTGISYRMNVASKLATPATIKALAATKAAQQDSPLKARFRRIREEMDGLYHYRIKPIPFDATVDLFRIPSGMELSDGAKPPAPVSSKSAPEAPQAINAPPEFGEGLLAHVISLTHLGGVVTMNDTTQLNVNGELHKEGDVFTVKVQSRLVLIRIKSLTTSFVTFALDDPASGQAEMKVRLK